MTELYKKVSQIKDAVTELKECEGLSDLDLIDLTDIEIKLYEIMSSKINA